VRGVKRVNGARGSRAVAGCTPFALVLFEMPRHALHHREDSGLAWGPWLMDLRRDWLGGSTKHLRWSSTASCPRADRQRQQVPLVRKTTDRTETRPNGSFPRSAPDQRRWTTIAGALRVRRANRDGDPSTMGPTPPPNPRDGAGRDTTKPAQKAGTPATGAIYPLYPPHLPLISLNRG